jgi:hypothetical protein
MTKFYLTKNGFNALFNNEVPDNVRRCDGLWADVLKSSGLVYTKLEVVIKDCKGNELFRSREGKSKYKQYQKAYQDALRKAFMSFKTLNVSQPELVLYQENELNIEPVKEVVSVSETRSNNGALPTNAFSTYSNNDSLYLLRKNKDGYTFYKETEKGDLLLIGTFSLKANAMLYNEIDGNSFDVTIDELGNISIYSDGNPVVYRQLNQ